MSRYRLHRVQALWPIAAAGLLLVVLPGVAWADDCGSLADCFHGAVALLTTATTGIITVIVLLFGHHAPGRHFDDHGNWIITDPNYDAEGNLTPLGGGPPMEDDLGPIAPGT